MANKKISELPLVVTPSDSDSFIIVNNGVTKRDVRSSLKGPKGDTGNTGPQGAASSVPGPEGPTGPQGPQGPQGDASTVAGPKGDTGSQGIQGIQGVQGLKGDKGDTGATGPAGADSTVPGPTGPAGGVTDHTLLSNIGTNAHSAIDTALTRLANTSGTNTGNQIVPANTTATTNQWLRSYDSSTGAFTKTQPTWANILKTTSNIADITTKSHTSLTDIGTNTHAQIDTALTGKLNTTAFSGLTKITVGTTQPTTPGTGDLWVDTN